MKKYNGLLLHTGVFIAGVIIGVFVIGYMEDTKNRVHISVSQDNRGGDMFDQYWDVWGLIEERYLPRPGEELDKQKWIHESIKGLTNALEDNYTEFLPPEDSKLFLENIINSEFFGIGVEITKEKNNIIVVAPLKNSPGERAGLQPKDIIYKVDDTDITNFSTREAVSLIRGEEGAGVVLTIIRAGEREPLDITIIRERIKIPTIEVEKIDDVTVISLYVFNERTEKEFKEAFATFIATQDKKLIIDLRNNPGGLLSSAIALAGLFVDRDDIIVYQSLSPEIWKPHRSNAKNIYSTTSPEIIILTNKGSASASEIFAGALQHYDVATVVGTQTFGKDSVQEYLELQDGSSVKITISYWQTASRDLVGEIDGLVPDVEVEQDFETEEDEQLLEALELFK